MTDRLDRSPTRTDPPVPPGAPPAAFDIALALRASNLAERTATVAAAGPLPAPEPDPVERWQIDRAAERLAASEAHRPDAAGTVAAGTERIRDVLTTFGALDAATLPPAAAARLRLLHADWLPAYAAALTATPDPAARRWWTAPDVYVGRLAAVFEPFLRLLAERLAGRPEAFLRAAEEHLLDRLSLAVAWAVEVDGRVHCAERGIDPAAAPAGHYRRFLHERCADPPARHAFFLRYPVLGRWMALLTDRTADEVALLADRLDADAERIGRYLLGDRPARIAAVRLGLGDAHAGGRTVAAVTVETVDGRRAGIVYKPRCVRAEAGLRRVLGHLRQRGVLGFATHRVLALDGYGYEERVPDDRNAVGDRAAAGRVYRELGGQLALVYALGGGDLHLENLIVADGHAHVCDAETVLCVAREGERRPTGGLLDSVFGTGMLEWPQSAASGGPDAVRISGYRGGEPYELPVPVPRIDGADSFTAGVRYRTGVRITPSGANRVRLDGAFVPPQEHTADVVDGFERVHRWLRDEPGEAATVLRRAFAGARVRFLNWSTEVYVHLLTAVSHPRATMDPLECDLTFGRLWALPSKHVRDRELVPHEIAALWRRDIPLFGAAADGAVLDAVHGTGGTPTGTPLAASPIEHAVDRIRALSAANRDRQVAYITASLTVTPDDDAFRSACVDHAALIGDRLCRTLDPDPDRAPWRTVHATAGRTVPADVGADLYAGTAGIALFLAYLDAARPDPAVHRAARRALDHARRERDRGRIGAFDGGAGTVYLLTHLARLWDEPALRDEAVRIARGMSPAIGRDRNFDVLAGAAGVIPVLLGLAGTADGAGLDVARACADHLLRHRCREGDTASWPPYTEARANLTGMAHGAGGVGWALAALGVTTGRDDLVEVARDAFRHEARHFDAAERDWYDLRTGSVPADFRGNHFADVWCNGAAGIGLTRLATWDHTGRRDDDLLREAGIALTATVRAFAGLAGDSLCHGRSGNAEFLLRFARTCDEPAWRMEANLAARDRWRTFDELGAGVSGTGPSFLPGLMLGLSGIGMHLLALADPDRVPSVLLLEPPRTRAHPRSG